MPKRKTPSRTGKTKTAKSKPLQKNLRTKNSGAPRPLPPRAREDNYSDEYVEYLERYELFGEGRPRLSPPEFDRLDDEMLDLLALELEQGVLTDEQIVRLQELEYLLLDEQ